MENVGEINLGKQQKPEKKNQNSRHCSPEYCPFSDNMTRTRGRMNMASDNYDDYMIPKDECGQNSLKFVFKVEEKPRKNPQPGNLPNRGSNRGPLRERQRRYPWTTAVTPK